MDGVYSLLRVASVARECLSQGEHGTSSRDIKSLVASGVNDIFSSKTLLLSGQNKCVAAPFEHFPFFILPYV